MIKTIVELVLSEASNFDLMYTAMERAVEQSSIFTNLKCFMITLRRYFQILFTHYTRTYIDGKDCWQLLHKFCDKHELHSIL